MLINSLEPIQSLWVGGPLPAAQRACMQSFMQHGHPFHLYCYQEPEEIPKGVIIRDAAILLPREEVFTYGPSARRGTGSYGGFANLFRYELLAKVGGYWADTDVFCLKPFPQRDVVIASELNAKGEKVATNFVLRFPPGHHLMQFCRDRSRAAHRETLWFGQTGPRLMQTAVRHFNMTDRLAQITDFCPINWTRYRRLTQEEEVPSNSFGIHLWNEMFRRRGETIPWPREPRSLLGRLHSLVADLSQSRG